MAELEEYMKQEQTKLSVVILNWNTRKLLKQCLKSLISNLKSQISNVEIIVVDNASHDGSQQMIRSEFPKVKIIQNENNLGYAKGNNVGIAVAVGKYVMLLNTDIIIKKGAVKKLVEFLDKNQEIAIVGPKILNTNGSPQSSCGRFPSLIVSLVMLFKEHFGGSDLVRWSPKSSQYVDWLVGAAFIARKEVFEKIGGFDEKIFMYMEEVEWFYRSKLAGFKTYFLIKPEVVHLERGSSKSGKKDPILNIYRGLIYFYRKHKPWWQLVILKLMLKIKALLAILIGYLKNDNYLKETYGEAYKIS